MQTRRWTMLLLGLAPAAAAVGCGATRTRIDVTSYQAGEPLENYAEFREAWYRLSPAGLVEVVMRTERPSTIDPTQIITQIVYLKTFWNPRPGTTYVESTQIDARLQYAMLTLPTGIRYDGAGFLTYHIEKPGGDLVAELESANVTPRYRLGEAVEPFGAARLSGTIRAKDNPRAVVETLQMLATTFKEPAPAL